MPVIPTCRFKGNPITYQSPAKWLSYGNCSHQGSAFKPPGVSQVWNPGQTSLQNSTCLHEHGQR